MNKDLRENNNFFSPMLTKIVIVGAYITIFAFFLYLPVFMDLFFKDDKTLNVLVFAETFSSEAVARFEAKTGIKVKMTYAEIDEQVVAKFEMNKAEGYDVVNSSDQYVYWLIEKGLLHKLQPELLTNFKHLDPNLLDHDYDSHNTYSVPHKWYVHGLVYDKAFFKRPPEKMSFDFVFKDPQKLFEQGLVPAPYKVCMQDDARDMYFFARVYLNKRIDKPADIDKPGDKELKAIQDLLVAQKKWVEAYTVHSSQHFLFTGIVPIALMSSNYMRAMLEDSDRFDFAIPEEGSMLIIENLIIPQKSKKVELAHQFIDFMISDEIATLNSTTFGYNSSNKQANINGSPRYISNKNLFPDAGTFQRLFMPLFTPDFIKKIEDVWLAVGFA